MIYGLVMKCETCGELVLEKIEDMSHTIVKDDKITFLNRYVCGSCIARNQVLIERGCRQWW